MKNVFVLLFCLGTAFNGMNQNLVSNGSFELSSACPTNPADFGLMTDWGRPTNHLGNADYYDVCGSGMVGIPSNYVGSQTPHTGNAYAGLVLYYPILFNYREYLSTQLTSPMVAGQVYCVSFWVNLADTSAYTTTNALGIHFSNSTPTSPSATGNPLPVTPQVEINQLINDVVGWTEIQFNYTASGGEEYLTIGNFRFDSGTNATLYNPATNWWEDLLYVLIDDLVVEPLPDASWDTPIALCSTDAPVDLSTMITGTSGGNFSGTGVSGSTFDPSAGTQSIMYTVGSSGCADTLTQTISVIPSCTLPVEFGELTATTREEDVLLNWNTLSELNSSHFVIERLNDNMIVEEVIAQGNSQSETLYRAVDERPLSGINYYQLTAIDLDGTKSYTETISVDWKSNEIKLFPNPANNWVTIELPENGVKTITLISAEGKIIREEKTEMSKLEWNISDLPDGVYHLKVKSTGESSNTLFVIRS